jgi:hypothetical protein
MRKLMILLSFLTLAACQDGGFHNPPPAAAPKVNSNAGDTIIGGEEAQTGSEISKMVFSFKSLLKPLDSQTGADKAPVFQCTASALTRRVVLTAAHCINGDNPSYLEIMQGSTVTTIPVVKTVIIDEYKTDPFADLALAVLKDELPEGTITVSIPSPEMQIDLKKLDLIAAGYGKDTDSTGEQIRDGLGILRVVLLNISKYEFEDSKFLVDQTNSKGFCEGDSGGPGLFQHEGRYYIMGVASKNEFPEKAAEATTGLCSFRGAYVNLLKFKKWIEDTTKDLTAEIQTLEAPVATTATSNEPADFNQ